MTKTIKNKFKSLLILSSISSSLIYLVSCGTLNNQDSKQVSADKNDLISKNKQSNKTIENIKEKIDDAKSALLQNLNKEGFKHFSETVSSIDRSINLKTPLSALEKSLEESGYSNSETVSLILNSFHQYFEPKEEKEQPHKKPQQPAISQDRINQYVKKIEAIKPKGQNRAKFNPDGTRIVTDQYEYDNPKSDLDYFTAIYSGEATVVGSTQGNPDGLTNWDPNNTKTFSQQLNQQARTENQPLPGNAWFRGFSTPDGHGKIHIPTTQRALTTPALQVLSDGKIFGAPGEYGLPRVIPNEKYKKLINSAVSISVSNAHVWDKIVDKDTGEERASQQEYSKGNTTRVDDYVEPTQVVHRHDNFKGTFNIIDYKLPEGNTYPLTWYFITNAHVANAFQLANDTGNGVYGRDYDVFDTHNRQYNTDKLNFFKLKPDVDIKTIIPLIQNQDRFYDKLSIKVRDKTGTPNNNQTYDSNNAIKLGDNNKPIEDNLNARTIVIGTNPFKTSIGDYTNQDLWKNKEEFMDFAVVEITFDNEEQARTITGKWYEEHSNKDAHKNDKKNISNTITSDLNLLDSDQYKKFGKNELYSLGYPASKFEKRSGTLEQLRRDYTGKEDEFDTIVNFSLSATVNKPTELYYKTKSEDKNILEKFEGGGDLSWSRSFRSFVNLPGLNDLFITSPYISNGTIKIRKYNKEAHKFEEIPYVFWGLATNLSNMSGGTGMSGSGVYYKDKLYSLVFAADDRAATNISLNVRSYGHDYHGYYGTYNLPKYDLIYGDGTPNGQGDQKKSYFDAMQKLMQSNHESYKNIKTYLFPNGFDDSNRINVFQNQKSK